MGTSATRFPDLHDLILEWEECLPVGGSSSTGTGILQHSMRVAGGRIEPLLPCPNPRCRDGGFEVECVVESIMSERLEERAGLLVCTGWEGERSTWKERTPCTTAIRYRIRLRYRETSGEAIHQDKQESSGGSQPDR